MVKKKEMKQKQFKPLIIFLSISILLFIGFALISKIFKINDIPMQFMGAFLGAVVTAFITMILLFGQSKSEELKERNVKVFEEKTKRYNLFIEELWKVWEDKEITLEELSTLIKMVAQNIIPYTKKEIVKKILENLNDMSDNSGKQGDYNEIKESNQKCIFNILDILSKEIDLGGELDEPIRVEITKLEEKILPVLHLREFKKIYLQKLEEQIINSKIISFDKLEFQETNKCYYIYLKNSNVQIEIDNFGKKQPKYISYFVEYDKSSPYNLYREAKRGDFKYYLKNFLKTDFIPSFKDKQLAKKMYKKEDEVQKKVDELFKAIEKFYQETKINNKTIEEIISECEPKS